MQCKMCGHEVNKNDIICPNCKRMIYTFETPEVSALNDGEDISSTEMEANDDLSEIYYVNNSCVLYQLKWGKLPQKIRDNVSSDIVLDSKKDMLYFQDNNDLGSAIYYYKGNQINKVETGELEDESVLGKVYLNCCLMTRQEGRVNIYILNSGKLKETY